jgi:four helix bundle protein
MIADRGVRSAERREQSARVAEGVMSTDDFRRRTFRFGIRVVRRVQTLSKAEVARVIGNQLLRSGTAVGANYRAAARARSRADFIAKMGIVEEECDETLYWIDMLIELELVSGTSCKELRAEANEILAIVVASIRTARRNIKQPMRYTSHG